MSTSSEARFLNKSKFMPTSCLARDPRVHAQLKNKAGFLNVQSWSPAQAQTISFLDISKFMPSSCLGRAQLILELCST